MNIASDPKSIPQSSLLSPEANQLAELATATGILTVDLDAIVANWRKCRAGCARPGEGGLQDVLRRKPG